MEFLPFSPGLVGGHCIGVDPYYLSYKSQSLGYQPEIILAGRRINDGMSKYVALQLVKKMTKKNISIQKSNILIMGVTFKEDCPDTRNTKVLNIVDELKDLGANVETYDPWVSKNDISKNYQLTHIDSLTSKKYDALVFAVAHQKFKNMKYEDIKAMCKENHIIYDLKYVFSSDFTDLRL